MSSNSVPVPRTETPWDWRQAPDEGDPVHAKPRNATGFGRSPSAVATSLFHPALLDGMGIAASVACVLHCAAIPVIALAMPLLADELAMTPLQHRWVMYSSVLLCLSALVIAFRHPERSVFGLFCSSVGVVLIATATIGPDLVRNSQANMIATNAAEVMRSHTSDEPAAADAPLSFALGLNSIDGLVTPAGCVLLISGRFVSRRRKSNRCCKPVRSRSAFHTGQTPHHKPEREPASVSDIEAARIPRPHFQTATLPIVSQANKETAVLTKPTRH